MFDLINGLPVHALVVHVVVVLLPLLSVVTVVFVIRPRWRRELPWAILGNAAVVVACFVAKKSGGELQARLSNQVGHEVAAWHAHLATILPYFAIGQLVASIVAWLLIRGRSERAKTAAPALALAVVVTLGAGIAATVWTYRVGDSGARAVWGDTISSTKAP
jgi:uncharacterized membrane protein